MLGDVRDKGEWQYGQKSLSKTTTTAGDDYNHDGDSARDGEAEAGEEGLYMAILEGGDNSKRRPSLLRRSGSRAGSVRRDCAMKVG